MMQVGRVFAAGIIGLLVQALPAAAAPLNPSFETVTGRLPNSWTQAGNVGFVTNTFGKTPPAGNNILYLMGQNTAVSGVTTNNGAGGIIPSAATLATSLGSTTTALNTAAGTGNSTTTGAGAIGGSAAYQTFSVAAGSTLSFRWDFLSGEDPYFGGSFHNDFGFVSVNGVITVLGRLNAIPGDPTGTAAYSYIPFTGGALNGSHVQSFLFETGAGAGTAAQRLTDYNNDINGNPALGYAAGNYLTKTLTFASAGNVTLGFGVINVHSSATGGSSQGVPSALLVDNLIYTEAVPEPASMGLLAIGGVALIRRRKA